MNLAVRCTLTALCVLASLYAKTGNAHGRWMFPSHTTLSGEAQVVTFDLSISNDLFHPDLPIGGIDLSDEERKNPRIQVEVMSPEGEVNNALNLVNHGRKSVFSHEVSLDGTHSFNLLPPPVRFTNYRQPDDDKFRRVWGGKPAPAGAVDIEAINYITRLTTYVTLNAPTTIRPDGRALELAGDHPSDFFAGEASNLKILLKGRPLSGANVKVTRGNTRHRNDRAELALTTDAKGVVAVDWPEAGYYLIEVEHNGSTIEGIVQQFGLFAVVEVLP